ncbi:nickel-dependent hydrogenase large subunit [Archaeoglobus neptunius]|uniref:nickel-dependent hydrogenase large subunit n=1 Tax=Archaeoglobus neptunius TaxID=2798580 RepID=UPI0019288F3B|nr:nickel-dependent hydrogenase large subunit [Archaeoglobus neptunius]
MSKVVIDPVTRIEGHLRVEMATRKIETSTGKWDIVDKAYCSGTLFRGWETILRGRDPRDAWIITQRICGVCPAPHGETSIQAIEAAYGVTPTPTAILMRNILHGAYYIYDHIIHTYILVGPELGVVAKYPPMVPPALGKDGVAKLGLGSSYVQALEIQRKANEIVALWGGKFPHHQSEYPGGMAVKPTDDRIASTMARMFEIWRWVAEVMVGDFRNLLEANKKVGEAVSSLLDLKFRGLQDIGASTGYFLSYGLFPDHENYDDWLSLLDSPGRRKSAVIYAGAWDGSAKPFDLSKIAEYVKYSWYDNESGLNPKDEDAPKPNKNKAGAYSWLKAPRYEGKVYEVGPLARMLNTFGTRWKIPIRNPVTGEDRGYFEYTVQNPKGSVVDRVAARVALTIITAQKMFEWLLALKEYRNEKVTNYKSNPKEGEGFGLWEAPRGALLHYINIRDHKIANYQCVVPSTWNLSPRDDFNQPGPVETALTGTWLPNATVPEVCDLIYPDADVDLSPFGLSKVTWGKALAAALTPLGLAELNVERVNGTIYNTSLALLVVRSFDPCIACAVHVVR